MLNLIVFYLAILVRDLLNIVKKTGEIKSCLAIIIFLFFINKTKKKTVILITVFQIIF